MVKLSASNRFNEDGHDVSLQYGTKVYHVRIPDAIIGLLTNPLERVIWSGSRPSYDFVMKYHFVTASPRRSSGDGNRGIR